MRDVLGYIRPVGAGLNMPGYSSVVGYNAYLEKRCARVLTSWGTVHRSLVAREDGDFGRGCREQPYI